MGIFDRLIGKKTVGREGPAAPAAAPATEAESARRPTAGGVLPQLAVAREKLKAKDLAAAMAIYEDVLAGAAERSDVLVTISADLGTHGHMHPLIELLAPRYDAEKHGAAAGVNLLQAYLATRNAEAAQHLLDLLFSLQRPELEGRLVGFSNAIAELFVSETEAAEVTMTEKKVSLVSISKPVWFYGLEASEEQLLASKTGRLRRLAFAQLSLPGLTEAEALAGRPEDDVARLTRGLPLWLSEMFAFSAGYSAIAVAGVLSQDHYVIFPVEWTSENVRQLNDTGEGGLDYIVTGALRVRNADYEAILRIWEVRKFRELKNFLARWTPATADEALRQLQRQLSTYMEWAPLPAGAGLAYAPPSAPLAYIGATATALSLFLGEKNVLPPDHAGGGAGPLLEAARAMPDDVRTQLLLVTALRRLQGRGLTPDPAALDCARAWLASDAARDAGIKAIQL